MTISPTTSAGILAATPPTGNWNIAFEGISPAWTFLFFALIALGTVLAYRWCAPAVSPMHKWLMVLLRIGAGLLLSLLHAKPVLHMTSHHPVRQPLAVLLDGSESMAFRDRRERPDDLKRAAIAVGRIHKLDEQLAPDTAKDLAAISRQQLIRKVAENNKLSLWPRLAEQAELQFYQFGRKPTRLAFLPGEKAGSEDFNAFFQHLEAAESSTAIGESLRQVLQEPRQQPLSGVLLVTDGANNSGSSPIEASQIAKEQGVPLFIYGVGVTSPRDILVRDVTAPKLAFVNENLEVHARIVSQSMEEKSVTVSLMGDGLELASKEIAIGGDAEQEVVFQFAPKKKGELKLEVVIPVQTDEASDANNTGTANVRVTDTKFHVLLIEREPRWDFRYLLDFLERDPRLTVKCKMINGEPDLDKFSDSPFLAALPSTREEFFNFQVIILGDVSPDELGIERMGILTEWVGAGGGLIFQSGPNFNPVSYGGTPLAALLPIVPDTTSPPDFIKERATQPFKLELSKLGQNSPYLRMDEDPEENRRIWEAFPGVRWTAPISRLKPGAEVLLVDPRPERGGRYGMLPVFAMQGFGSGKCVYFGTDETYRWRSRTGEKYYSVLWGQIMQTLSLQLLEGASALTQLKSERSQYAIGDKVVIAGNVYTEGYQPFITPTLEGTITMEGKGKRDEQPFQLHATEGNYFRGEFVAHLPGSYRYASTRDPEGVVEFEIVDSRPEQTLTALDENLLKAMAENAGGHYFREESLDQLPGKIAARTATIESFKRTELYHSGWMLTAMLAALTLEWLARRLTQLK